MVLKREGPTGLQTTVYADEGAVGVTGEQVDGQRLTIAVVDAVVGAVADADADAVDVGVVDVGVDVDVGVGAAEKDGVPEVRL